MDTKWFNTKDSDFTICFDYGKIEEVFVCRNEYELNDPNYKKITYTMQATAVSVVQHVHTHRQTY